MNALAHHVGREGVAVGLGLDRLPPKLFSGVAGFARKEIGLGVFLFFRGSSALRASSTWA